MATLHSLRQRFDDSALSDIPKDNFGDSGVFVVADYHHPAMALLLAWPPTLEMLRGIGFSAPKLHNFYVSAKPPGAAALPWNSDLFYLYEAPSPSELFLIYYLQDTMPENGCLSVVPKSHLWSHEQRHAQPNNADLPEDEVDVPVTVGDLFAGDRRILHATHANTSNSWRTCLTIAYAPDFAHLAEPIQALIMQNQCLPPKGWSNDMKIAQTIDPPITSNPTRLRRSRKSNRNRIGSRQC